MNDRKLTTVLTALAGALCLGELVSALIIWKENYADAVPAFAVVFGVLFLIGAGLLRGGRVTAGNSAGLTDGATAAFLAAEDTAEELGLKPGSPATAVVKSTSVMVQH